MTTTITPSAGKSGFINRLSTGTGAFDVLRPRKIYYLVGIALVVGSVLLILLRGFNLGTDFAGGTKLAFAPPAGQTLSSAEVSRVVGEATGLGAAEVQKVGESLQVTTSLDATNPADQVKVQAAKAALVKAFGLPGAVTDSAVSGTWGAEVSQQAIISVIVFLIAVALFIWIRYERRASIAAVVSTVQVLIITAGIYSLVGFELSPSTVIGLLTILGFSLYDTVVVFDKVQENTRGLTSLTRRSYGEAANLAINQTLMRSINTSLIALLPVAGLLIAGIALLGSGTLKDLALVQLVGMIVGVYSSLFVAVPLAVDLRLREPTFRAHTKRVQAKRAADGLLVDAVGDPIGMTTPTLTRKVRPPKPVSTTVKTTTATSAAAAPSVLTPAKGATPFPPAAVPLDPVIKPGDAPRPGVRPAGAKSRPRPTGKSAKPTGKRRR